jgi:hypothetical protein
MEDLIPAATTTLAHDVSTGGTVVGSYSSGSDGIAFRWPAGQGLMPLTAPVPGGAFAVAINDNDVIVGGAFYNGSSTGLVWDAAGSATVLPTLGGLHTEPRDVNNSGVPLTAPVPSDAPYYEVVMDPTAINEHYENKSYVGDTLKVLTGMLKEDLQPNQLWKCERLDSTEKVGHETSYPPQNRSRQSATGVRPCGYGFGPGSHAD